MASPVQVNVVNVTCAVSGYQPSFDVTWVSDAGKTSTFYQIQLFTGTAQTPLQTPVGSPTPATANLSGTWAYARQVAGGSGLEKYKPYWLAVQAVDASGKAQGPQSEAVLAIFVAVPLSEVAVSDRTVTLQWSRDATLAYRVDGFMAQITDAQKAQWQTARLDYPGYYTTASGNAAQTASFVLNHPLELAAQPLALQFFPFAQAAKAGQVSNTAAFSQGPVTTQNLYTIVPEIQSATFVAGTSGNYAITLVDSFGASVTSPAFAATVQAGATVVGGASITTPKVDSGVVCTTLTLPGTPANLARGARLTLTLRQTDGASPPVATGPASAPRSLLTTSPTLVGGSFTAPATPGEPGSLTLDIAPAPGVPEVGAASFSVIDSGGKTVLGPMVASKRTMTVNPTLSPDTTYTVSMQAISGPDAGPFPADVPFPTSPPALLSASYDGAVVRAAWTAPAGATPIGYRLDARSGSGIVASADVAGVDGAVSVVAPASGLCLEVAACCSPDFFGPGRSVALLCAAPCVTQVTTDAVSGLPTVSWTEVPKATGYLLTLFVNGAPQGKPIAVTGSSHCFETAFPAGADSVALAATALATVDGQDKPIEVTGPLGPSRALPTVAPRLTEVVFDGTDLTATWSPATGATGYAVSVVVQGVAKPVATFPAGAEATSATHAVTLTDTSQSHVVCVQAQYGPDLGPPSTTLPLFASGLHLAPSDTTAAQPPVIYPAANLGMAMAESLADIAFKSGALTCALPPLAKTGTTIGPVAPAGPFSLAPASGAGSDRFPFTLTIAGGSSSEAWTFDGSPVRAGLQADYVRFLQEAEAAKVSPYGIALIQRAIARLLPQTFAETLYYAYGFNTDSTSGGSVDLRPGMVLRVAADPYLYINNATSNSAVNAFVGGPSLEFEVSSYLLAGNWTLGLDAFFAQFVSSGALNVQAPPLDQQSWTEQPVADAADLFFPAFNQPFYRVFLPSQLLSPWTTGSDLPANNFAIAAAGSFTDLCNANNKTSGSASLAYFGGRAVLRLCVRIAVDGRHMTVPIGTTVGNVLDQLGRRPPNARTRLAGVELRRPLSPVVPDPQAPCDVSASIQVRLDWKHMPIYSLANDGLDLPVLHGDVLSITGA